MKTKAQKGFTLIEVIIGMATGAIVVLATGTALVSGHIFWNKALEKVNLQRDASHAMLTISQAVKEGTAAQLESDGKAITIYREAGWIKFDHAEHTSNIRYVIEGGPGEITINDNVEYLQFNLEGNKVTIDLRLNDGNSQNHFVTTVMMRNTGG